MTDRSPDNGKADAPRLSALVVAHNEAHQLADCLQRLSPADELVVVLDRCTDASASIATSFGARLLEGGWELEGQRRNAGIDACDGDWILEVDADERVPEDLFAEIKSTIANAEPGYFLIPFHNYVGQRLVKYGWGGSWGVMAAPRLFSRGTKRWGDQRIHPALQLTGPKRWLETPIDHYVDRDLNDMIDRLKRYTDARAADLVASGQAQPPMISTMRRSIGRFIKCYWQRKGYREGRWGLAIAIMAALYPLIAHIKADLTNSGQKS